MSSRQGPMAPAIIFKDTVQGEVFLPRQIFIFGGFVLQANSLGHLEQIDSYAPGHQVRFGSLNYTADIRGDLIFNGFEPVSGAPNSPDEHDLIRSATRQYLGDRACCCPGNQSGADRAIRGRVDGPRHGGRTLLAPRAEH